MHGHDFLLLATGTGQYNSSVLSTINFKNPTRRDVASLPNSKRGDPTGGFMVIGFPLDNPGIWVLPSTAVLTSDDSLSYCMARE